MGKTEKKARTIMDIVLEKCPSFDPSKHSVTVNSQKAAIDDLKRPAVAFDVVKVNKARPS